MSVTRKDWIGPWLVSIPMGAIAVIVTQRANAGFDLERSTGSLLIGALVFLCAALLTGMISSRHDWPVVAGMFIGIAPGSYLDAELDWYVYHIDQNLWPLGIWLWCIVGAIPIAAGFWFSALIQRHMKSSRMPSGDSPT